MRAAFVDEYSEDGETVVLLEDGSALALSPLASLIVAELAGGPVASPQLAAALVEAFGPPPGDPSGLASTNKALMELLRLHLLMIPTAVTVRPEG